MNTPRFTVGSVTGYAIPIGWSKTTNRAATIWYVHDSAMCYRIVQEFRGRNSEHRARTLADHLNAPPTPKKRRRRIRKRHGVPLCVNWHELHPWNHRIDKHGIQHCRVCEYDRAKRYQDKKRAEREAA